MYGEIALCGRQASWLTSENTSTGSYAVMARNVSGSLTVDHAVIRIRATACEVSFHGL